MISRDERNLPRPTQDRTKAVSLTAKLRELFGKVAEALTGKPTPYVAARRKRREETQRGFRMAARKLPRRAVRLPPEAYAAAAAYFCHTLDWLNPWHHDSSSELDDDFSPRPSNYLYPHL